MRRRAGLVGALLAAACAGPTPPHAGEPDWRGAPVHVRHRGDGSLEIEFVAPTAGHEVALRSVARTGARADVVLAHQPPRADFVAQVVTPLRVVVPAAELGDAAVVAVRIADGASAFLAVMTARPR